jgi:hypothetical protein
MGLSKYKHKNYYQSNDLGYYQFTSLNDIIDYFMVVYVGDQKIIQKVSRMDVAFHAKRAIQELNFDTLKSIKSQQIDVPSTLVMSLPHDYINYTKLTWVDSAGIKHPLYPTNRTSNPFQIRQEDDDGEYSFPEALELVINGDFEGDTLSYNKPAPPWNRNSVPHINNYATQYATIKADGALKFRHRTRHDYGQSNWGHAMGAWQKIDVSDQDYVDVAGTGTAVDITNGDGVLRLGISTSPADSNTKNITSNSYPKTNNVDPTIYDLTTKDGGPSYLEWLSADGVGVTKELTQVDVKGIDEVFVVVVAYQDFIGASDTLTDTSYIDDLTVINSYASEMLAPALGNELNSSTWNSYKSTTPSENNNDDYEDDTYWPANGERYGLDPQHAQANGSFFIDPRLGRIHFSSNISGKTVVLDYITDGLNEGGVYIHKFAEEAIYKWITHAILSTSSYGQALVPRLTKDKFAAVRKAKLRLSNIKLEELTQVLRGKSKQIKH